MYVIFSKCSIYFIYVTIYEHFETPVSIYLFLFIVDRLKLSRINQVFFFFCNFLQLQLL